MDRKKAWVESNGEKTRITRPGRLKYLEFGFYKDGKAKEWKSRPHKESMQRFKRTLKKLTERRESIAFAERVERLNRVIIWKQWKVPRKRQWGLEKLGIGKDLAGQTAYMGNYYQWIVTKTCVVRAISKEKLKQAGLISCYDYYMERHTLKLC